MKCENLESIRQRLSPCGSGPKDWPNSWSETVEDTAANNEQWRSCLHLRRIKMKD